MTKLLSVTLVIDALLSRQLHSSQDRSTGSLP